ncbi:hypothetical protein [Clostridium sp.]|uniref:hypothetical protein n=1 Tax=Clostridium sp. TaxID=1506 RepID=UPI002842883F|nr:hypothetical protein [Clostridium sp.]MDR3598496.1 hypothetical protein [Clostridium sp.]
MDFNNISIEKFVQYINLELSKDKSISVNRLCDRIGIKKSTLKSRMTRANYSYNVELRQYLKDSTTSNNTEILQEIAVAKDDTTSNITELDNVEIDKLKLLLNNLDSLLKLVEVKNNTSSITINSNKTRVTSLRINEELYDLIKNRSIRDDISISDIVNRALMDYLNNYI